MWLDVVALKQINQISGGRPATIGKGPYTALFIIGLVIVAFWLAKIMLQERQADFVTRFALGWFRCRLPQASKKTI